jgi:hypothetical protein
MAKTLALKGGDTATFLGRPLSQKLRVPTLTFDACGIFME